jgi:hypothetical protein
MTSGGPSAGGSTGQMLFGGKSKLLAVIGDEVSQMNIFFIFFIVFVIGYGNGFFTWWYR